MNGTRRRSRPLLHLGLLAICFLLGDLCGLALASGMPEAAGAELRGYLGERAGFFQSMESAPLSAESVPLPGESAALSTVWLYLRFPLLAALLGVTTAGGFLLCVLAAVFGFLLSFSVGCFAAAFGEAGVLLAASALGIRCLFTLPCFFLLAVPAMDAPRTLAGQARRMFFWRLGICAAVLLLGVCADLYLTPLLLRQAMALL